MMGFERRRRKKRLNIEYFAYRYVQFQLIHCGPMSSVLLENNNAKNYEKLVGEGLQSIVS